MDTHAHTDSRMILQRRAISIAHCTGISGVWKNTCPIPPLHFYELCRLAKYTREFIDHFSLLVDQQLRATYHVNEQNVRNRQMSIGLKLRCHFLPSSYLR